MTDQAHPFPPRAVRRLGGRALERILARALAADPATAERVGALEGRSVELTLRGMAFRLRIDVRDGALRVGPVGDNASLRVATTPASLVALALDRDAQTAPGSVEIAGDAALARQIEKIVKGFEPDIEAAFAGTFGEVAGVPLARVFARAAGAVRRGARMLVEDGAAFVRDEARLTPAHAEVEDFLEGVDALSEDLARLEARAGRLPGGAS